MKPIAYLVCLLLCSCALPSKTENFCLPKCGIRRRLRGWSWAFVVAFTSPAFADEGNLRVDKDCTPDVRTCTVVAEDLFAFIESNNKGWEIAHGLREKVIALREEVKKLEAAANAKAPKCAELIVTEPSKNIPKPVPPIKRENDT